MRLGILAGALACLAAASFAHAEQLSAGATDPVIDACLTSAPDAASLASVAQATGGAAASDTAFANAHASIERAAHQGVWRAENREWTLGLSEGALGGVPARACYAAQNSETAPQLLQRIGERFPLFEVMGRTGAAYGEGVRETYAALIDGVDALIILEWTGDRAAAYPVVTVVTFPRGLGPAESHAHAL